MERPPVAGCDSYCRKTRALSQDATPLPEHTHDFSTLVLPADQRNHVASVLGTLSDDGVGVKRGTQGHEPRCAATVAGTTASLVASLLGSGTGSGGAGAPASQSGFIVRRTRHGPATGGRPTFSATGRTGCLACRRKLGREPSRHKCNWHRAVLRAAHQDSRQPALSARQPDSELPCRPHL